MISPSASSHHGTTQHGRTIRHAGKVHVRGKIRRVWRPRYLELCDDGLVRYFEITQDPTQQSREHNDEEEEEDMVLVMSHHDHRNNSFRTGHQTHLIPKATVMILQARIIDVTTLRDVHVGLPRGTFGFLIRGQPVYRSAYTNINPLFVGLGDNCQPMPDLSPRDYLCAVSTLEEAQSWVVALQWAASVAQWTTTPGSSGDDNSAAGYSTASTIPAGQTYEEEAPRMHKRDNSGGVPSTLEAPGSSPSSRSSRADRKRTSGMIVVTKICSCSVARASRYPVLGFFVPVIMYEIQMLLLRNYSKRRRVEERTLFRSLDDFMSLTRKLREEVQTWTQHKQEALVLLKKHVETPLKNIIRKKKNNNTSPWGMAQHSMENIHALDKILRALAMNADLCNSKGMREFLRFSELTEMRMVQRRLLLWPLATYLQKHTYSRILSPTKPQSTESFVKAWLQTSHHQTLFTNKIGLWMEQAELVVAHILQRPQWVGGAAAVAFAVMYPLFRLYESYFVFTVTMRIDVYVLSCLIAFVAGQQQWQTREESSAVQQLTRTTREETPPTKPSIGETQPAIPETAEMEIEGIDEHQEDNAVGVEINSTTTEEEVTISEEETDDDGTVALLSSPLPEHPNNNEESCWSRPESVIFRVRGDTYLQDRIKIPSAAAPFSCRGVDVWLTDNPERHISRHPSVLGGRLGEEDTFVVNFLLPFCNFVSYFSIPPLDQFPPKLADVWKRFVAGDQQYRDARLKLLPVVVDGPWIVRKAVGNGTAPALLGKVIPLQYFFRAPTEERKGVYEVDVIISASRIAKGILSVVKGHTKTLTIAFAFIIEAAREEDLPETILCSFQMHSLHLEHCPQLPECNLDDIEDS